MRIFTRLPSFYVLEERLDRKVNKLEQEVTHFFKLVFERLDTLENIPKPQKSRKKIGLNNKD